MQQKMHEKVNKTDSSQPSGYNGQLAFKNNVPGIDNRIVFEEKPSSYYSTED